MGWCYLSTQHIVISHIADAVRQPPDGHLTPSRLTDSLSKLPLSLGAYGGTMAAELHQSRNIEALALVCINCPLDAPKLTFALNSTSAWSLVTLSGNVDALGHVLCRNPLSICVREFPELAARAASWNN